MIRLKWDSGRLYYYLAMDDSESLLSLNCIIGMCGLYVEYEDSIASGLICRLQ